MRDAGESEQAARPELHEKTGRADAQVIVDGDGLGGGAVQHTPGTGWEQGKDQAAAGIRDEDQGRRAIREPPAAQCSGWGRQ